MTDTPARLRVLVSAYACGPNRGSEPGVGWNAVCEISRDHDVWVITSKENRDATVATLGNAPASLQFVFLDWPDWLGFVKRSRIGFELQHYCWQLAAFLKARALHKRVGFDLAHHVTVCRYWMPSFAAFLGIPFIWGPVGGGESAPKAFWSGLGIRGALLEVAREIIRWLGECEPMLRLSARRAALGVATTEETAVRMRKLRVPRVEVFSQVTLTESELDALATCKPAPNRAARFISIGRLLPWKGFHLGLRAFARMHDRTAEYWIVGSGPAERSLKSLARALGVENRVLFLGPLSRADVLTTIQHCDVLVHPSLHDSGAAVCAEMMGAGRPVICLDLGGPGRQVTADTGMKIPAQHPGQVIRDVGIAMDTLAASPSLRLAMGQAARSRIRECFSTMSMRAQFNRWYQEVAGESTHQLSAASDAAKGRMFHVTRVQEPHRRAQSPVVSAIMPTFNKGQWLQPAIDSVLAQTFSDWELIIVDDASTDNTADVLDRITDPRITIERLSENVGRATARNIAIQRSRGRYIAICDSDDVSAPTRFERHVAFLDSRPDIAIVSAHMRQLSPHGSVRIMFPTDHESIARRLAKGKMGVAHGASMIRAECFETSGLYCDDLRWAEDFELFRRFSLRYRFEALPEELLQYRHDWGAVPMRVWAKAALSHRYALYRSNCSGYGTPALSFDDFVASWRTRFFVYTLDTLRFAHFKLRTHVFADHVLR